MTPTSEERTIKPDFEKLSLEHNEWAMTCLPVKDRNDHPDLYVCSRGQLLYALEKVWRDYVVPLIKNHQAPIGKSKQNPFTAEQYYKRYEGYTKADRHNDCPMTWDNVIMHTEDFAKAENATLTEQNAKLLAQIEDLKAELKNEIEQAEAVDYRVEDHNSLKEDNQKLRTMLSEAVGAINTESWVWAYLANGDEPNATRCQNRVNAFRIKAESLLEESKPL